MNLLSGNELSRTKKPIRCCKVTLNFIHEHVKYLEKDESDTVDWETYTRRLFLNFTQNNLDLWINYQQLETLRNIEMKGDYNKKLVDQLMVTGDDGRPQMGPYLKLLERETDVTFQFAQQYEWVISKEDVNKFKRGKYNGTRGLSNDDLWYYNIHNDMIPTKVAFAFKMVAGFHDNNADEKMVGMIWSLEDAKEFKSINVSVELYCPDINKYYQWWNANMRPENEKEKHGVNKSGHTDLFKLSELKSKDPNGTFRWTVIIKAFAMARCMSLSPHRSHE